LAGSFCSAQEEAPPVESLKDLKQLNRKLVRMSGPGSAATVALVSSRGGGAGSGVVVSEEGLILTAAHVVDALRGDVIVFFPDGTRRKAEKLGADFGRDAAMVRITEEDVYPHVEMGSSGNLRRNDWCVALGHPGGFDSMRTPPVRLGRVLSNGQFLTTDCAVVGGDSGGPLFNAAGEVIGIHSNIGASLSENRHVPVDVYRDHWDALVSGKQSGRLFAAGQRRANLNRPVLGVRLGEGSEGGGVRVESVMEKSPAAKAGIREGDVILSIGGKKVGSAERLIEAVGESRAGDELPVSFRRDGEQKAVRLTLVRYRDLLDSPPRQRGPQEPQPRGEPSAGEGRNARGPEAGEDVGDPELEKLLDQLAGKAGELEDPLTEEDLGGMKLEEFLSRLRRLARSMSPAELEQLRRMQFAPGKPDEFFVASMRVLAPVTRKAARSTVAIEANGRRVAFGTAVSEDGWILTKDTETRKGRLAARVNEKALPMTLVKRFPKRDLALFSVAASLVPVDWSSSGKETPVGSLLTATAPDGEPLGIGLVSVRPRAMEGVGFLGIEAGEARDGILVVRTTDTGPAEEAGLRNGDVILSVDGKAFHSPLDFGDHIRSRKAGAEVEVAYRRGEEDGQLRLKLGERNPGRDSGRMRRMNEMSGPLSQRQTGFPEALQHDIPINPVDCGGPLLDLRGRCVGINVSRAGRVKTIAIPAADVLEILAPLGEETAREKATRNAGLHEVLGELEGIRKRIGEIDSRLQELQAR
jgi:serine protease Do